MAIIELNKRQIASVYVPFGCDQQGRQEPGRYIEAEESREGCAAQLDDIVPGVFIWPLAGLGVVCAICLGWYVLPRLLQWVN